MRGGKNDDRQGDALHDPIFHRHVLRFDAYYLCIRIFHVVTAVVRLVKFCDGLGIFMPI